MQELRIASLLLFVFIFSSVSAQTAEQNSMLNKYYTVKSQANDSGATGTKVVGSPFYEDDFQDGFLFFPDHDPFAAEIRYDIVQEEMQVRFDGDQYRVLDGEVVVELKNLPFMKFSYRKEGKGPELTGYFEVLTTDFEEKPLLLVRKYYKEIERGQRAEARGLPAKYKETSDLYLKFEDSNSAVIVERRLKNFLPLFKEEYREEMESFIRDNNLKPRKTEDLKLIVDHFNTL